MPIGWIRPALLLVAVASPALVQAQEETKPPFYDKNPDTDKSKGETAVSGSITSSSFFFSETGGTEVAPAAAPAESASTTDRVFTELRLKLRADHLAGGKVGFNADLRGRTQLKRCKPRVAGTTVVDDCLPSQSGTFGGEELDARELYFNYKSSEFDFAVGRQFMHEVAAIKFDGLRVEQHKDPRTRYFGFGGLYPARGSRDYRSDYPVVVDPVDPTKESKLLPAVAGAGVRYERGKAYGSVGIAGILPRGDELETGLPERTRLLLSSNGYWAQSEKTDLYHYLVIDAAGANGAGISNLSLGANHRPTNEVNIFAQVNRVDTETLNVHAQLQLDQVDPEVAAAALVQNNWYISRVAQESARLGASSSFSQNRFQLTASAALRRRPEITLLPNDPAGQAIVLPLAQALDIRVHFVDRKSYKGFRIGGSATKTLPRGDENLDRAESTVALIEASRDLADGAGEFEVNINYIQASDQDLVEQCGVGLDFLSCYGTSESSTLGAGGLVFYRPKKEWFVMGMMTVATQTLTTSDAAKTATSQPAVLMFSAFARLAYRF